MRSHCAVLLLLAAAAPAPLAADPVASWILLDPTNRPFSRYSHAMTWFPGAILLFGGDSRGGPFPPGGPQILGDTWTWDGTNWTQKSPANSPSPRYGHAMAPDPVAGESMLFGGVGYSSVPSNDTWGWDGNNWRQKFPISSPPGRLGHALSTGSGGSGFVVLFGGAAGGFLGDTWEWNGSNWSQKFPVNSPSARSGHAMAYDAVHHQVLLFGGVGSTGPGGTGTQIYFADTWIWDGVNWT